MQTILHPHDSRGEINLSWLQGKYSFSFADYYNPNRINFGKLRVLNDDIIQPEAGFDAHSHHNMEIVSIPLSGALMHKDSLGNETIIPTGDVQVMSAGTGITHSEYNASSDNPGNFLQIWILPNQLGLKPSYQQKTFDEAKRKNQWQLIVSPDGRADSLYINQEVYFSLLDLGEDLLIEYQLFNPQNGVYLFLIDGLVEVNDSPLVKRDAIAISNTKTIELEAKKTSKVLLIETLLSN